MPLTTAPHAQIHLALLQWGVKGLQCRVRDSSHQMVSHYWETMSNKRRRTPRIKANPVMSGKSSIRWQIYQLKTWLRLSWWSPTLCFQKSRFWIRTFNCCSAMKKIDLSICLRCCNLHANISPREWWKHTQKCVSKTPICVMIRTLPWSGWC
jgi:hypothetical protein